MGRILAIDYGLKRVGIAVTDPLQIIATSLDTIEESKVIDFLKKYIEKEKVDKLILGYPTRLSGEDTHITQQVIEFEKKLNLLFPTIPIYKIDERFTSKIAKQVLLDSGIKKEKRKDKKLLDSISATLILQTYLETQ